MRTPLQIAASRANGAKSRGPITPDGKRLAAANSAQSTGPVTPEGKLRSSQNAIRHGLLADSIVLEGESEEAFFAILEWLTDEFQPASQFENSLVEVAAVAHWRHQRAWSLEKAQYISESRKRAQAAAESGSGPDGETAIMQHEASFRSLADSTHAGLLLSRYETRHYRAYQGSLKYLESYRAAKHQAEAA